MMKLHENQWVDALLKGIIISVLCYKLFQSPVVIDIINILFIIIALFSIWLSVEFYHRAGETSNNFYDRVFEFTKESSIMLGRIEAAFGEKLDNMGKTLERYSPTVQQNTEKLEEEKEKEIKATVEQKDVIEELMDRAKLADEEKNEVREQLEKIQNELAEINKSKNQLEFELKVTTINDIIKSLSSQEIDVFKFIIGRIGEKAFMSGNMDEIKNKFQKDYNNFNLIFKERLRELNMVESDGRITSEGIHILKYISERRYN